MGITVDVAYKSLNKYTEILCGDKVELLQTEDSNIMILADGMGSGVKANILSTLTSKILGTMFLNGATLEECVDTISETLPICQVRQVAYSTFSILQVYHNGDAYLVEYDNPGCIFIRDGKLMEIPKNVRVMQGKEINEYRFKVKKGDALILMSDGTIHAGVGELLNFGWADNIPVSDAKYKVQLLYVSKLVKLLDRSEKITSSRLLVSIMQALNRIKEESLDYSHKITDPVAKKRAMFLVDSILF